MVGQRAGAVKSSLQSSAKEGHKERHEIAVFASSRHGIVRLARGGCHNGLAGPSGRREGTPGATGLLNR